MEEKHSGGDWVIRGLIGGGKHALEQRYFFRRTKSTKMKQRIAVREGIYNLGRLMNNFK